LTLQEKITLAGSEQDLLDLIKDCNGLIYSLDEYIEAQSTKPSKALVELEKRTNEINWDAAFENGDTKLHLEKEMVSGAVEGQFLKMLVALTGARRVLEIGSFTGYASLAMAESLPDDGELIACEYDPYAATFARNYLQNVEYGKKIRILTGEAKQTLVDLASGDTFDLVFIDADKSNYLPYYEAIMNAGLVRMGGLICVDNTLYQGEVYAPQTKTTNGEAVKIFNAAVAQDPRVEQVVLPLRDGITLIRRVE